MIEEAEKPVFYDFADFRVDAEKRLLYRGSEQISLTPKVFETLLIFLEHHGEVLEKDRLMNLLWADSFVEESNLAQNVAVLRKALGEDSKQHKYILTIPGRGYRFVADVKEVLENDGDSQPTIADSSAAIDVKGTLTSRADPKHRANLVPWLVAAGLFAVILLAGTVYWFVKGDGQPGNSSVKGKVMQLTTWTGLDVYPAISSDGNTIVFSSDRSGTFEIYLKQLVPGAREVQLTSDGQQNLEPAISPHGDVIAYYSKNRGGVWIVPITGGLPRQITDFGSHPAWSPNGDVIAFQSDPVLSIESGGRSAQTPSTIWLVEVSEGRTTQITKIGTPAGGHGAPSWSPDGKRIVFDTNDWTLSNVWSMSVDGSDLIPLTKQGESHIEPIYSSDGSSVYVIADTGGTLEKIDVSSQRDRLGVPVRIVSPSGSRIRHVAVAAKSNRLVYTAYSTTSNIYTTSISAGIGAPSPVQLTHNSYTRTVLPDFSPDGKKIAYQTYTTADTFLWMMDSDGSSQTQLTATGRQFPRWFPDSRRIGFWFRENGQNSYWSLDTETAKQEKLFDFDGDVSVTTLSPDGSQVAYNSTKSGTLNVWVVSIGGGAARQLTFDNELAGFPCWSPDGKLIAFEMKRESGTNIYTVPSDGGEPTQITKGKGQSWPKDWSPEGDKILFAGQRNDIWNVYSVSRSSKEVKQLTHFTKLNSYVRYPAWSPLNDRIAYEYAETTGNIWMLELK